MVRAGPSSLERSQTSNGQGNGDAPQALEEDARPHMEIGGPGRSRRLVGFLTYALLFLAVCAVLIALFVRFTGNLRLAIGLVLFMSGYMLLMGWWASRGNGDGQAR